MESAKTFSNLVLYSYWRSSCSWRIRIVLNLKKINYEIYPINLLKSEQKNEKFAELNPFKKVPAFSFEVEEQGQTKKILLQESSAICEFLEENFSEINVLPKDTIDRAQVRAVCSHIACNIQPIQNLPVLNRIEELGFNKAEWAKEWITKGLKDLDNMVTSCRGKYCFGDKITLADAFLVPQLYNARRFNIEMGQFPNLVEIEANLKEIEAFRLASPENQPDSSL
jgi:maleylacetoacetate isomerase